jgi:hypothetical protein
MGEIYTEITLKNMDDVIAAEQGYIKASEVRAVTVQALVETAAPDLIISEAIRQELGLGIDTANAWKNNQGTEAAMVYWKNRSIICQPWLLPNLRFDGAGIRPAASVLLGRIPLEGLDLMVDPVDQQVVGKHGDRVVHRV